MAEPRHPFFADAFPICLFYRPAWSWCTKKARSMRHRDGIACHKVSDIIRFRELWKDDFSGTYWMFRGQTSDWPLKTSLERACDEFKIELKRRDKLEKRLIREFRRKCTRSDRQYLQDDTLYCLSMMQHYGSPTRLLDWTYSPFVALYFAMAQSTKNVPVVWCINQKWLNDESRNAMGYLVKDRSRDETRNEKSFVPLFMSGHAIALAETPMRLHERLIVQQGSFLCPATNGALLMDILTSFDGYNHKHNLAIIELPKCLKQRTIILFELSRMNVNRQTLFPGLDGFAQSLWQRINFFDQDELDTI